jgi:hypothetical protein
MSPQVMVTLLKSCETIRELLCLKRMVSHKDFNGGEFHTFLLTLITLKLTGYQQILLVA